ncbi:HepT-like ribonuclease domain-containing protein [Laspinema olomoucense]|uniref:DUF86 domain-containing protein n=1 Tax=Laspinema olomoucense D3b TaxID=2953688 RepID=A0ABT2NDI3_9CYAN|nr:MULTISPECIES: DUF86 domain-containing protein [unclassified Laspinema]MCT7980764.1 DUF86 domain-containing protein [Laspinema sp. D3b]MCT7988059.1 DUF86 domain-containing protein [Laspinema sp. D3a]MCT7995142.1 DUF86 domain-containing protein [Laspinema sp. D3c]
MPQDLESLIDIENAAKRILRYASGIEPPELITNDEKVSAILYQITIIGEATKRLSMEFRQHHPEIPWRNLAGMRDVIVHEYDQVDLDIVWDVIHREIPKLLVQLEPLVIKPHEP